MILDIFVVVFELVMILFFAIFARIATDVKSTTYFGSTFLLLLGFCLLACSKKRLAWTSCSNLILVYAITVQWYILIGTFFNNCFNGFTGYISIDGTLIVQCGFCALSNLLTILDLVGKLNTKQIFIVSVMQTIGYSLNAASLNYGLKIFDDGGGMQVFLFSGLYTIVIWLVVYQKLENNMRQHEYTYETYTVGFIGLIMVIWAWPSFNFAGTVISSLNTSSASSNVAIALQNSAATNTFIALSSAILSCMVMVEFDKMRLNGYINSIIAAGIVVSSSADVILNPVVAVIIGCISAASVLATYKFIQYPLFTLIPEALIRIVSGLLSGILASILVAARNNLSPTLVNNASDIGGKEVAALLITILIAVPFAGCTGLLLNVVKTPGIIVFDTDALNWEIKEQIFPLYDQAKAENPMEIILKTATKRLNTQGVQYGSQKSQPTKSPYVVTILDTRRSQKKSETVNPLIISQHKQKVVLDSRFINA